MILERLPPYQENVSVSFLDAPMQLMRETAFHAGNDWRCFGESDLKGSLLSRANG
jgi:hypothetical protein